MHDLVVLSVAMAYNHKGSNTNLISDGAGGALIDVVGHVVTR